MKAHPLADRFPMLSDSELQDLADDIQRNGLHEPIVVSNGAIIDGRNRYAACQMAGVEPRFSEWDGEGSVAAYIVSMNLHRRHMSASQRAAVAVDSLPYFEAEARERQERLGRERGGRPDTLTQTVAEGSEETGEHRYRGWWYTSAADFIAYVAVTDHMRCATIRCYRLADLRSLLTDARLEKYPTRTASTDNGLYHTEFRPVPAKDLRGLVAGWEYEFTKVARAA